MRALTQESRCWPLERPKTLLCGTGSTNTGSGTRCRRAPGIEQDAGDACVVDQLGETATFTSEDLTLLQTLTSHLAVALRSARLVEKLGYDATNDALTGLTNRRALYTRGQARLVGPRAARCCCWTWTSSRRSTTASATTSATSSSSRSAARLREQLRAGDLLARLGGDEFAVLLDDAGLRRGRQRCRAAQAAPSPRSASPFSAGGHRAAHRRQHRHRPLPRRTAPTCARLLRRADIAMYKAKTAAAGHHVYSGTDDADGDVQAAYRRGAPHRTGRRPARRCTTSPRSTWHRRGARGVEALVRWDHPTRGLLYPDAFLDLVEEAGLMRALTQARARAGARPGRALGSGRASALTVAVNLSASSLVDADLPEQVVAMLAARRLPPGVLQLEITEDFLMADRDRARDDPDPAARAAASRSPSTTSAPATARWRYLRDLPIDELKLDRSFVCPMADDARAAALVASTHRPGPQPRACAWSPRASRPRSAYTELARLGCDQAQGFFMSRPVPAAQLDIWLHHRPAIDSPSHPTRHPAPSADRDAATRRQRLGQAAHSTADRRPSAGRRGQRDARRASRATRGANRRADREANGTPGAAAAAAPGDGRHRSKAEQATAAADGAQRPRDGDGRRTNIAELSDSADESRQS